MTNTISEDRPKIPLKTRIHIISPIFFHLYREENGIVDRSEQRSILKILKPPATLI
jgi:hypothetical protein